MESAEAAKVLGLDESALARIEKEKSQRLFRRTRRKLSILIGDGL